MSVLEVGKRYIAGLPSIEPRTEYNFRKGEHSLLLCFSHLTEAEVAAVRQGETEFGLLVYGLVIFMIYRFGSSIPWSTAPRIHGTWFRPRSGSFRGRQRQPGLTPG